MQMNGRPNQHNRTSHKRLSQRDTCQSTVRLPHSAANSPLRLTRMACS
jgi:hypothetical protein